MTRFPRPRVVVLGASNVSRGLSRLVATVESRTPGADLFVAAGHGRGYGVNTRVAARRRSRSSLMSAMNCSMASPPNRSRHGFARASGGLPIAAR